MKTHRYHAMFGRRTSAATCAVAALLACTDAGLEPAPEIRAEGELLFLGVNPAAAPTNASTVTINAGRPLTHRILHLDQFSTQYLEIAFPAEPVRAVGNRTIASGETVDVTIRPESQRYAATLEPVDLVFEPGDPPRLRFTFGRYGDRSVADGSARYPTRAAYGEALRVWLEVAPGQWERIDGSFVSGSDAVVAPLTTGGRMAVAAPR